jgi:predicted HTH transcriptional regulator
MMEWTELLTYLKEGNSVSSWFFKAVGSEDELGTILVSMANTKGGHIFIGVDLKNYHLVGTQEDPEFISYMVERFCFPHFPIKLSTIDRHGKKVLVISVPESTIKPCFYKKRCFVMSMTAPFGPLEQAHLQPPTLTVIENEPIKKPQPVSNPITEKEKPAEVSEGPIDPKLNERQRKTVGYLGSHFSISNKTYRSLFEVSHKTAHIELVDLIEKGYLQTQGSGRSTCYIKK